MIKIKQLCPYAGIKGIAVDCFDYLFLANRCKTFARQTELLETIFITNHRIVFLR